MFYLLIVLFAGTLVYVSIAERFRSFAKLIAAQGILLFGIALIELKAIDLPNLIFVAAETLIFKAIVVPYLLYRIISRTQLAKVHPKSFPAFYSLLFALAGLIVSIILSDMLKNPGLDTLFMTIALFTLFTGVLLIVTHRRIFSHMVGFLIIENAVFFFSLAVGSEMPMLINIGILLDIFVSVLIIGILMNRIGEHFNDLEADNLTRLKH